MNKIACFVAFGYGFSCFANASLDFLDEGDWKLGRLKVELSRSGIVSDGFIQSQLGFQSGDVLRNKDLDSATKQLDKTGYFDQIQWKAVTGEAKSFDLVLKLNVCPNIEDFRFTGNKTFSENDLLNKMSSRVHKPCNQQLLSTDVANLIRFYKENGFANPQIQFRLEQTQKNFVVVHFDIKEGERLKITNVRFEGVSAFKPSDLANLLQTKTWGILSWITKTGRYREDVIEQDIETIHNYYFNAGYLDAEVTKVQLDTDKNKARITFHVNEGVLYTIGSVKFTGDAAADTEALAGKLCFKEGEPAGLAKIEYAKEIIRDFYGHKGYACASVKAHQNLSVKANEIDLIFEVNRGLQYTIHSIYISGNMHTQSKVLLREINMAPGDILDSARMRRAEQRLQNTGFFKTVILTSEDCNAPCEKNLKVAVEENKTGSVLFSGNVNSVEKFTFGITLSQNNFDYKNSKDYFRGAGQKFQLGTSLGKYTKEVNLSFEEPWLLDRELRFGFNLFFTKHQYSKDDYKQVRMGGEVYLAKRLFEQVVGKLYYRLDQFKLTNVSNTASAVIKAEQGTRVTSKVGFLMERDTRDQLIYPTQGNYLAWDNQVAGLGGKTKYFRTNFSAAQWFLVNPNFEQVFLIGGRIGFVKGFGGKKVPLFEREFLGGPDDLRGFEIHEVGPKTNDGYQENLGGKMFAFLKPEYSVKVHPIVRIVGFYDIGQVKAFKPSYYKGLYDEKSGGINSDIGLGLRLHIMGAPFRLDFAFPLKTDKYNKKKAPYISYSFGVSF